MPVSTLRPWTPVDASIVYAAAQEPLMERQLGALTREDAAAWVSRRIEDAVEGRAFFFAVLDERGDPVGNVAVSAVDRRHLTGWVSYWLLERAQGRGLATRAVRELAEWAFTEQGLFRLELAHRVNNPASCRVAVAAGFAAEGVERAKLLYDGTRYDAERHARLATDPAHTSISRSVSG